MNELVLQGRVLGEPQVPTVGNGESVVSWDLDTPRATARPWYR